MYKKLLSFKRKSTDEILSKDSVSYKQIPDNREIELDCSCNCLSSCCRNFDCCRELNCPQAPPCQLCTASLVLPSCVGAIRALQHVVATAPPNHKCCTSGRQWTVPATDASTMGDKWHVIASTRCCSRCC
ncbi:hypothetical protein ACLKA6_005003 [Drosophila palustris]